MLRTVSRPRPMVTRQTRGTFPAITALAFAIAAIVGSPAFGQAVRPFEPRFVVVDSSDQPFKAGPASVHYAVVMLSPGQVLRADGETADDPVFLRVEYPPGVSVFVKADESEAVSGKVRLTAPSRLRAANLSGGERGHWWFLLPEDAPLPTGTELAITETLRTDNRVYGYLAAPPKQARGFVRRDGVRDASPEEIAAYQLALTGGTATPAQPATATPAPVAAVPRPAPAVDAPAVSDPQVGGQPVAAPAEQPAALVEPALATTPATEPDAPLAPGAETTTTDTPPAEAAAPPPIATLESLASLFQQAQAQPIREAELAEVMAELQRAIEAQPDTTEGKSTRTFLNARLEVLRLRADLQKSIRAAEELAGATSQRDERFAGELSALDRTRSYAVVGRLMPSTVYDGRRLPRMFRVQSVDEGFSRTVAYLAPAAGDTQFDSMIGRVVGIVGDTQIDPALRVNIIRPKRVDVLSPTPPPAANGG